MIFEQKLVDSSIDDKVSSIQLVYAKSFLGDVGYYAKFITDAKMTIIMLLIVNMPK